MVTADFDWVSLLILIVAGVIGAIKSSGTQKKTSKPVYIPTYTPDAEEEETEERYTVAIDNEYPDDQYEYVNTENKQEEEKIVTDYYKERPSVTPEETEEEEESGRAYFDIRQAIISSEILKRPEY